tara:strand:+ start:307 stop:981 length:675 start_codon:yes stop_codon:yes gene_type:complete
MNHYVYLLKDSSNHPFYIGKTKHLAKRRKRHLYDAKRGCKLYIHNKIRKILREGLNIDIEALETGISKEKIDEREQFWIAKFKKEGTKLCNLTNGGEGGKGMTAAMQKAAAEKRRGQKKSKETKRKISKSKKGKTFSAQHKKSLSKAWKRTTEQKQKQAKKCSQTSKGKINIKKFLCTDPSGKTYTTHNGLTSFCEKHGLTIANLSKVANGERKHHKGWTAKKV